LICSQLLTSESDGPVATPHLLGLLNPTQPVITASKKRELLLNFVKQYDISLSETLCVGDGANDLEMLNEVGNGGGLGIAFKAKPKVQEMVSLPPDLGPALPALQWHVVTPRNAPADMISGIH
jgi:hypothetical protein